MPSFTPPAYTPLRITVRSLRAQHDGAEILVGVVLEDGEHREQKSLFMMQKQERVWQKKSDIRL